MYSTCAIRKSGSDSIQLHSSGTRIPKVLLPKFRDWGDILRWQAQENVPGSFPFTAGSFPLKRETEDPTRMFAGEGSPERTNKRFHYLSASQTFYQTQHRFRFSDALWRRSRSPPGYIWKSGKQRRECLHSG